MQKAATSIVKTALPGYATQKAYKDFRKCVAEGYYLRNVKHVKNSVTENAARTLQDVPPPVPPHGMPHIPEGKLPSYQIPSIGTFFPETEQSTEEDSDRDA